MKRHQQSDAVFVFYIAFYMFAQVCLALAQASTRRKKSENENEINASTSPLTRRPTEGGLRRSRWNRNYCWYAALF